ncbi:hypothetical protein [Halorubrum tibetense]|uniref:Cox cluster protein n=1 Tax=Halorubrum tibetense TaxID=175631 RepID=A0ABD5S987_9EURY
MRYLEAYRTEAITLLIVVALVVGTLEGFHIGGVDPVAVVGVGVGLAVVSMGILRAIAVAEGLFLAEAISASVLIPPVIEPTLRFELIGVWLAVSFVLGVVLSRVAKRTEPASPRVDP